MLALLDRRLACHVLAAIIKTYNCRISRHGITKRSGRRNRSESKQ
jgi:hypothetical protein